MTFTDIILEFYYGPALAMLITVLCSYVLVYVVAMLTTRIWMSLRRGTRPMVDQIAHRVLLICFVLCLVMPIVFIAQLAGPYPWHVIPFALAILLDLMILAKLFGKLRQSC